MLDRITIDMSTPARHTCVSRGFYQAEEDLLYVPIFPAEAFYSYLDSEQLTLDIDNRGRLLLLQVLVPRRQWATTTAFPPADARPADISFRDFRSQLPSAEFSVNSDNALHIAFAGGVETKPYQLTENLLVEVNGDNTLCGFWVLDIVDDRGAQRMARWRKYLRKQQQDQTPRS